MAKLNGVKTVDMVNGEITKIAYEEAAYAKVDGKAEVGDIVVNNRGHKDLTIGGYYSVLKVYDNEIVRVTDDVSDGHDIRKSLIYGPFRKIPVDKPTLEQRVGDLESDVAALKSSDSSLRGEKVAEEPKRLTVGDVAKIIGTESCHFGEIGDIVKIKIDAKDRQPYKCERISDGKDVGWFYEEDLEAYVEETIEFEGATYRKVDREAREGGVVIFRKNTSGVSSVNKPYKAITHRGELSFVRDIGNSYWIYSDGYGRTRETVDVYEAKYVPQEGDIVVVTDDSVSNHTLGDIGKITEVDGDTFCVTVPDKKNRSNWLTDFRFREATPAEVEKYEQAIHKASFAVGDYVKVVKSSQGLNGEIVKIIEIDGCMTHNGLADFKVERLDGKTNGAFADQLVKATDAEIAQATAPKLKTGDFVKITNGTRSIVEGKTYELFESDRGIHIIDKDGDKRHQALVNGLIDYEILSAEEAKWAKIGRKPNEFKKGDIVRVLGICNGHEIAGQLGEIVIVDGSDRPRVRAVYEDELIEIWTRVELVAPVESLFNTNA